MSAPFESRILPGMRMGIVRSITCGSFGEPDVRDGQIRSMVSVTPIFIGSGERERAGRGE
ncbi:MAG TPA: hypothetical protein VL117_04425 [Thermoleophilia bacterium]|nr:hypothetical protein [Thermoleophilia bacterium]